ncbi:16S rRNA (cytosine(967)-C(5))-methyltransferase RsmB [Ketobacter sp.]|uniref:16S rRNA (cytosine(967)-C(5))-methyltransferase RsmB n=1 Tax=Ketobacter sp. TaxID=2083498 RepID=UPI000F26471E|nr:16S rRNA (cytosine(967)-C(5))-methyltransferase RsmB [Ketobacter sp.]RLT99248.1 MAG: 16S rRNA (cytosine(967)-C(5))-methyltransferase RsmB [Ketobacter sp.]
MSAQTRLSPSLNTRARAAVLLEQVLPLNRQQHQPRSLSDLLPQVASEEKDQGLLQELCFGVCRWYTRLDKLAAPLIRQPFKPKDAQLHALLLVGLYQMFYLRIPDHAAISETVEACRQLQQDWAVKVINGMLRTAQRDKALLESGLPDTTPIQTAHPKWLVDAIEAAWPQQAPSVFNANNEPGPMCLRVNVRQGSREQYLARLRERNISARAGQWAASAVYLEKAREVSELPGFDEGAVSVQDEAAQLSAFLLDPQPGERILDACAAPGGKTGHLLEQQPALAELVALDMDARRLTRVQDNLNRLHLNATLQHSSLEQYAQDHPHARFDRILLDAPCSATGVIRRHPDIKWLRKRADIGKLADTQQRLLQIAFALLKPGGTLLYATCSVLPQENSRVVNPFLKHQPRAVESIIEAPWGQACEAGRQLFPSRQGHDGFYYARILHSATPA